MKVLIAMVTALFLAEIVHADWTTGQIARLYPNPADRIYFRIVGDTCKTSKYWYFDFSGDSTKAWFSMLLTAVATGTELTVFHPACDPNVHQAIDYVLQDL